MAEKISDPKNYKSFDDDQIHHRQMYFCWMLICFQGNCAWMICIELTLEHGWYRHECVVRKVHRFRNVRNVLKTGRFDASRDILRCLPLFTLNDSVGDLRSQRCSAQSRSSCRWIFSCVLMSTMLKQLWHERATPALSSFKCTITARLIGLMDFERKLIYTAYNSFMQHGKSISKKFFGVRSGFHRRSANRAIYI